MPRAALPWLVVLLAAALPGAARADRQMDPELRGVLAEVLTPRDCFADRYEQAVWFAAMGPRLSRYVKDETEREQILHHVHCEARRVDVPPELVLAVMDVESRFDRYAVSSAGAVGLMQVMPFWPEQLGMRRYELTRVGSNIRMGCAILRHYLGVERNNLNRALARYNGSLGRRDYSDLVIYRWSTWNGADDLGLASANQPVRKASGG
jgi:soluble lytic murein transglycosylase-like protein